MKSILSGRAQIAKAVNATVIDLDQAPKGYSDFDSGVAKKLSLTRTGCFLDNFNMKGAAQ